MLYWQYGKSERIKAAYPPVFGGANPPDERKEGDANECYIFGLVPGVTFHCCPCQSVSSDFQGKEISRHYCTSDGLPLIAG